MRHIVRARWTTLTAALVLTVGVVAADQRDAVGAPSGQPAGGVPVHYQRHVGRDAPVGGELGGIVSLAIGPDDTVYAVDAAAVRVLRIDAEGRLIGAWGSVGHGPGEFGRACMENPNGGVMGWNLRWNGPWCADGRADVGPSDVTMSVDGTVLVTDPANGRLQQFSPWGTFLRAICVEGADLRQPAGCRRPETTPLWEIAVTATGEIIVAMAEQSRLRILAPDGALRDEWNVEASDVVVDHSGRIWVGEPAVRQIRALDRLTGPAVTVGGPFEVDLCGENTGSPFGFPWDYKCNPLALSVGPGDVLFAGLYDSYGRRPVVERIEPAGDRRRFLNHAQIQSHPYAMAVGADGSLFVAQTQPSPRGLKSFVARFDADGTPIGRWDVLGGDPHALTTPADAMWRPDGTYLVLDASSGTVQHRGPAGQLLTRWGGLGSGLGRFSSPQRMAWDRVGHVIITDGGNRRIQRLTADGRPVDAIGGPAEADGGLNHPVDALAIGSTVVVVADVLPLDGSARIVRFDRAGRWLDAWAVPAAPGLTPPSVEDLTLAADGRIAMLDARNRQVVWLTADGTSVESRTALVTPTAPGAALRSLAFASDGSLLVGTDAGGVLRFVDHAPAATLIEAGCGEHAVVEAAGIDVASDGHILVGDVGGRRVLTFDASGEPLGAVGYAVPASGTDAAFDRPSAVAAAGGSVVVADTGHDRLLWLDPRGGASASVSAPGCGERSLGSPLAVAAAPGGVVVAVADGRVRFVGADGGLGRVWGGGALGSLGGVAVVPAAVPGEAPDVVAADTASGGIVRWAWDGTAKGGWTDGPAGVPLSSPHQIAVAPDRTLWVADSGNHRLAHFTFDGAPLGQIGGVAGAGPGRLDAPEGVAVLPDGTVVAADTGNRRLQAFAADGAWLGAWRGDGPPGTALRRPAGLSVAADGTLWVADREADRAVAFGPTAGTDWHLQLYRDAGLVDGPVTALRLPGGPLDVDWTDIAVAAGLPAAGASARLERRAGPAPAAVGAGDPGAGALRRLSVAVRGGLTLVAPHGAPPVVLAGDPASTVVRRRLDPHADWLRLDVAAAGARPMVRLVEVLDRAAWLPYAGRPAAGLR